MSKNTFSQSGGGFYLDLNSETVAGKPVLGSYKNTNPPIFSGELLQKGGNNKKLLDNKIYHLTKFIYTNGKHKLPRHVLNDF
jgi:hypothetical protein